tara:strand:- start:14573 stop:15196 length:624 start_codon:yes stop_codon:yes gene_type:complete
MNGYDTFKLFMGLKLHFSKKTYDWFKFNGKTKLNARSYENRKDRYFFDKIAKKFKTEEEVVSFFVSNLIKKNNIWIGELFELECEENYTEWKKTIQSLGYIFNEDCITIARSIVDSNLLFNDIFISKDNRHPIIMRMVLQNKIKLESFVILNSILRFKKHFDVDLEGDYVWEELSLLLEKYEPFLFLKDNSKYRNSLINKVKEYEIK